MRISFLTACLSLVLLAPAARALPECNFTAISGDEGCSVDAWPAFVQPVNTITPGAGRLHMQLNPERSEQHLKMLVDARHLNLRGRNDWFRMYEFALHSPRLQLDFTVGLEISHTTGGPTRLRLVRELSGQGLQYAQPLVTILPMFDDCVHLNGYWQETVEDTGVLWLGAESIGCGKKPENNDLPPLLQVEVPGRPVRLSIDALGFNGSTSAGEALGWSRIVHIAPRVVGNPQPLSDPPH